MSIVAADVRDVLQMMMKEERISTKILTGSNILFLFVNFFFVFRFFSFGG